MVTNVVPMAVLFASVILMFPGAPAQGSTDLLGKNLPLRPLLLSVDKMPAGWTVVSSSDALGSGCPRPKSVRVTQDDAVSFAGDGRQFTEVLRVFAPVAAKGYASVVTSLDNCKHDKLAESHGKSVTAALREMSLPRFGNKSEAFDAVWTDKGKASNVYELAIRSGNIIVTLAERSAGSKSISQFEDFTKLALAKLPFGGTPPIAPTTPPTTTTTTAPPPTTTTTVPPTTTTTRPPAPPPTTNPPPGQQAAFSCTGSAPEGVDITYGTDTSNLSGGSTVPWQASLVLPSTVEYANVTAQLQGPDGTITCATTVTWTQDGRSHTVTQTGTASGDYNIASAQICSSFDGGFETC